MLYDEFIQLAVCVRSLTVQTIGRSANREHATRKSAPKCRYCHSSTEWKGTNTARNRKGKTQALELYECPSCRRLTVIWDDGEEE
jgi:Zn finger protein HypA/HybF involved in hydrogenase expression